MAENFENIFKVMSAEDYLKARETGFIPDQPADINCSFIHACAEKQIPEILKKFYPQKSSVSVLINKKLAEEAGFKVVYEQNRPGGDFYWHFYRPENEPTKLLSLEMENQKSLISFNTQDY